MRNELLARFSSSLNEWSSKTTNRPYLSNYPQWRSVNYVHFNPWHGFDQLMNLKLRCETLCKRELLLKYLNGKFYTIKKGSSWQNSPVIYNLL